MASTASAVPHGAKRVRQWNILIPRIIQRVFLYLFLIILAIIFIFPFYDMVIGSFMDEADLYSRHPNVWPKHGLDISGYTELLNVYGFWRPLFNSFYLAAVRTVGTLFFCSLGGFTFAKRRFPGRDKLFFFMLGTMMLPYQATLIPWYLLMVKVFKWADTYWPLWLPAFASPLYIFWVRQVVATTIPDEMIEAATIDGCSVFGTFRRIVLPLIAPGLSVVAILTFIGGWNDFLGPLLILNKPEKITAPLALANFLGTQTIPPRYAIMFAGSTLATMPLVIIFFVFQKQLVSGIMSGALKGGA